MAQRPIKESVLIKTSAATDIQSAGGFISVAGLKTSTKKSDITAIRQVLSRAEVAQVVTVGGTAYTPTSNTTYSVVVTDPLRVQAGYEESQKKYSTTTGTVTGVAATDREAISVALVAKINADATNHAVAVTLGSGNGFTVTDDGGYYPVRAQNMTNIQGINSVYTVENPDGSGFTGTLPLGNASITTAGVYSYGIGAKLLQEKPVVDFVYGNLISGVLYAPPVTVTGDGATSGQNYNGFIIESWTPVNAIGATGQFALVEKTQYVFVDNGTGSSTSNLTGYKAFERKMHKLMAQTYQFDSSTTQEFFDKPIVFQDPLGAAPTGTANTLGWQLSPYGSLNRTNIGTQTIVAPVLNADGLLIDQDDTATEGSHTSANQQALGDQSFIVGKQAITVFARYVMADFTDAAFMVGLRKKAVYDATINNYTDYATIGNGSSAAGTTWINGDLFVTRAALNGAATTQAISAVAPADAVSALLVIKVAIDGTVTAFVNGTSYPIYSSGTTTMIFDAGDELIPFYQIVNIGGGDPACSISEFVAVPTDNLIS